MRIKLELILIVVFLFFVGGVYGNHLNIIKNIDISKKPKIKYRGTGGYQRGNKNVYRIYSSRSEKLHKNIRKRQKQSYRLRARSSSSKGQMW